MFYLSCDWPDSGSEDENEEEDLSNEVIDFSLKSFMIVNTLHLGWGGSAVSNLSETTALWTLLGSLMEYRYCMSHLPVMTVFLI